MNIDIEKMKKEFYEIITLGEAFIDESIKYKSQYSSDELLAFDNLKSTDKEVLKLIKRAEAISKTLC